MADQEEVSNTEKSATPAEAEPVETTGDATEAQEQVTETAAADPEAENSNNNAEAEKPAEEGAETGQEKTEETQEGATPQPEQAEGTPAEVDQAAEDAEQKPDETGEKEEDGEKPAEGGEEGAVAAEGADGAEGEEKEGEEQQQEQQETAEEQPEDGEPPKSPVPQSDTFAEGERAESPVAVGEKLSREASPREEEQQQAAEEEPPTSPPVPGTPERVIGEENVDEDDEEEEEEEDDEEEEYDEEEEEYEEEEPQFDREQLIEKYHQALAERQQLQEQNHQLQHKLAEYFQKKKSDDTRQDMDKNVTDQEQRYLKYMANLDDLRTQDTEEQELFKVQIEELNERCQEKQERVNEERLKFMEFKKQIALGAVNSRSGKPIQPKDVEQYLGTESRKESEVVNVRLENIKLKNKLKKKEMQLKSKEELAEGLHLIDFEQLKIENQTYNEKIEERNEELLKLRKKITSTVEVLTHLKEKLQFVQGENGLLKGRLREVEEKAGKKRDILSRTKQARDALRIDNQRLRQNCGLLGNEALLRDFEERKDEGDDLREKLERLKMQHAELTLNLNGVRRKIDQAKVGTS